MTETEDRVEDKIEDKIAERIADSIEDSIEDRKQYRSKIRKRGIAARDSLSKEERREKSERIVKKILASEEFQKAKTIMIYRAVRGEVRLEALEKAEEAKGKRLVYPLCISKSEMIALLPDGEDAWVSGHYGIEEPIMEKSLEIKPEEIDLVICPCSVFDDKCNRMGMGAGYYDRYLALCKNAHVVSVAFEAQKAEAVPVDPWDKPMEKTFTEEAVYVAETHENSENRKNP